MLHWFQALLPRDDRFFELLAGHSRAIVAGAHGLRALLEGGDVVPKYYRLVMDREHDADDVTRDILIAVGRSFITPSTAAPSRTSSPRWTMQSTRCRKLPRP